MNLRPGGAVGLRTRGSSGPKAVRREDQDASQRRSAQGAGGVDRVSIGRLEEALLL